MKAVKGLKVAGIIVGVLLIGLVIFWLIIKVPHKPFPDRFSNIPKDAIWKGAADEGFWFSVVTVDSFKRVARIRVYNDYNGGLMMDGNFKERNNCQVVPFTKGKILSSIFYYGFDNITLNKDACELELIKPAFGGEFWELHEEAATSQK